MKKNYECISRLLVALLIVTMLMGFLQLRFAYAQETLDTDYALYTFQWKLGGVDQSRPYVNVTLTAAGLDPTHMYKIRVWKYGPTPGPSGESHAISAVTSTIVYFLLQDIPQNLAGTYNASLYDETLARTVAKTNFGVWGLSGPGYNYGQTMLIWGGGARNGTDVTIKIYNATHDVTNLLLDNDTTTAGDYGEFTFMAKELFSYPKYTGTYNVKIVAFTPIVDGRPIQDTTQMQVSHTLRVRVYTDKKEYERLETVYITAEVYHLDWSPVIGGKVQAKIYDGTAVTKNLTRTIAGNYSGSWKIPKDAKIGVWNINVTATEPPYGNKGSDLTTITVKVTSLVVEITNQPPTVVNRASVVSMTFKVKYPDGSTATLDLTKCRVVVVNATTGAVIAIPTLTAVAAGTYNVSWYVPPYAPIGSTYKFLINRNNLTDNVTPPNIGPVEDVYSEPFAVEIAPIDVVVSTHDPATWVSKTVFAKTDSVGIRAKVSYHNGPPMAAGTVTASIYYPNGTIAEKGKQSMTWDPVKYNWYVVYALPTGAPSGTWKIVVDANDGAGNFGSGQTTFFVAGVELQPLSGTVGPTTTVDDYGVVSGSVYSIGTKSLGTVVRVSGLGLPPNKSVNITVTITTYHWYQAKYGTYDLLVLRNVPTDANGAFSAAFTFPTAPAGKYTIKAKVGTIVYETAEFEVVRGILLDPPIMAGSMVIKVIGTGFKPFPTETIRGILVNDTDAILGYNLHPSGLWGGDGNGTLRSNMGTSDQPYYVKTGFTFPVLVTGTYKITLVSAEYTIIGYVPKYIFYTTEDTIKVVSELTTLIEKLGELKLKLDNINATLINIRDNVATIMTNVGEIKAKVQDIATIKDVVFSINGTVGMIKTDVGTIKGWASDILYIKNEVAKIQGIKDNTEGLASKIEEVKNLSMPIYIAIILSLIAAIAAIICAVLIYRKIA